MKFALKSKKTKSNRHKHFPPFLKPPCICLHAMTKAKKCMQKVQI